MRRTAFPAVVEPAHRSFPEVAALAFCLCASGAYILNDLVDVAADRAHATKRTRPIASGAISPSHATVAMAALLAGAIAMAAALSLPFLGILIAVVLVSPTRNHNRPILTSAAFQWHVDQTAYDHTTHIA